MSLKKIPLWRDPLLHFALIGGLLFAIDGAFNGDRDNAEEILVTPERIEHLAAVFERSWQRPPSDAEMQKLVDNFVREEVLYREALKLGLEADDTVIRRRLRLKMEFLARGLVDAVEPEPEELAQFFRDQQDRYQRPARLSFRQLYFSGDQRIAPEKDARAALANLAGSNETAGQGDSHLLPRQFSRASLTEVDQQLGTGFATQVARQAPGQWAGPIRSEYGAHLVFVEEYVPPSTADFASVRAQVLRDWQAQAHTEVLERQYQQLRGNYTVRLEHAPIDPVSADGLSAKEVVSR